MHLNALDLDKLFDIKDFIKPKRIRVTGNWFPDFTIDMSKAPGEPQTKKEKASILNLIRPKITMEVADTAYVMEYGQNRLKEVDKSLFNTPTTLDSIGKNVLYIGAGLALIGLVFAFKRFKKR